MDFTNVPKKYRPIPFWSWNEKLNTEETARQIAEMEKQGMGGFFMHARGGLQTEYMGEEWFENVETSIQKCEENGMYPWAYDENGWPSGFGNGLVSGMGEEYQQKYLRFEEGEGAGEHTITNYGGYHFYYDVNPFYVDTLNEKVIKCFIEKAYQPYYDRFPGKLAGFFTDEPQISRHSIPWSLTLPEAYQEAYGENLLEHLLELFKPVGDYQKTRVKFWKLVTELFSKNYAKQLGDWCRDHGMNFTGHLDNEETLFGQLELGGACMPHYEYFSIPGMDWLGRHITPSLTPYQVVSAARQMGKKQVLAETFALCGHNVGHDELKWVYEFQMVRGVNLLCQHLEGYSNRGLRKRDFPPALYLQQPWWEEYKTFNDAVSRIGMLLSEGDDGVDVLVLHPQTTAWSMYDNTPDGKERILAYSDRFVKELQGLERKHVNFHLGDEIMMERHGSVSGKYLVIGEKRYSKVILPEHEILLENTKRLLEEFRKNGGEITTFEEIPGNDIIDVPEITYCQRQYPDFTMYYFVNSTEKTYTATIPRGNLVMDPVTGELSAFDGTHTFRRYESLVVIDDGGKREKAEVREAGNVIALDGVWELAEVSENAITLDHCDYYLDGVLEEKDGYVLNAMWRALAKKQKTDIRMEYHVKAKYLPKKLYLAIETPERFTIRINGKPLEQKKCGYFRDKAFEKLDVSGMLVLGENTIEVSAEFYQSEETYRNLEDAKKFATSLNKMTFDTEIEQIYLVGDFSVETDGEFTTLERDACRYHGDFVLAEPKKAVTLTNLEQQGFPFFAGSLTVKKKVSGKNTLLDFEKCGINVVKVAVNGKAVKTLLWEPYRVDLSPYMQEGENEVSLTLINNLRNFQGPFHLEMGETHRCSPIDFYQEWSLWNTKPDPKRWNSDYCFVSVSLRNRE